MYLSVIRWTMTSLSIVVWNIDPFASSSSERLALVRLPLWAMASVRPRMGDNKRLGIFKRTSPLSNKDVADCYVP